MPDIATATTASVKKEALFETPSDAAQPVHDLIESLCALDQTALGKKLNQHTTQIYSYDGRAAVTLKIPGFSDNAADASYQCMVYDQAHYFTQTLGDYDYDLGWTQRLVIKVTKWSANVNLTVPSAVAASCDVNSCTALVQYVVRGLSGSYKNLTGEAASFGVDQFAQYRIKMQGLLDDLDNVKMSVVPVVVARVRTQGAEQVNRQDVYRGSAYRLVGLSGIQQDRTVDELFTYMTTRGKDQSGAAQKIADETYFRQCLEAAYADYGIEKGKKLSDLSKPLQTSLSSTIIGEVDGFTIGRKGFA